MMVIFVGNSLTNSPIRMLSVCWALADRIKEKANRREMGRTILLIF